MNMHFRPKIQNGPIAKRVRSGSSSQTASHAVSAPASRPTKATAFATMTPIWAGASVSALAQTGLAALGLDERLQSAEVTTKENAAPRSRVLFGLIGCGVLLAGGFMFSLRDHFTAHAMGRKEVKLKSQLERTEAEQQQLDVTLKRVSSPKVLEQAAREAGLAPLEMERKNIVIGAKREAAAEKAKKAQTEPAQTTKGTQKGKVAEH